MVVKKISEITKELEKELSKEEIRSVMSFLLPSATDTPSFEEEDFGEEFDIPKEFLKPIDGSGAVDEPPEGGSGDGDGEGDGDGGSGDSPPSDTSTPSPSQQSDKPMDDSTQPENPQDRSYEPEGNVQDDDPTSGPSVGNDPSCVPIFDPSVARMKRGCGYDRLVAGGKEGYKASISIAKRDIIPLEMKPASFFEKSDLLKMHGKCKIKVDTNKHTPLYMPTNEINIGEYVSSDGSNITFFRDKLNNVYVRGDRKSDIQFEYDVYCKWSTAINNLDYYDLKIGDGLTLKDSFDDGIKIGFDFDLCLDDAQRSKVPFILDKIDSEYFKPFIDAYNANKINEDVRKRYPMNRIVRKLSTFFVNYGCAEIPGLIYSGQRLIRGDMIKNGVWFNDKLTKQGSCRHRAFGFFMCANFMGAATRYCVSDCHAYVEIWVPNLQKWIGMDLGGCDPEESKKLAKLGKFKEGLTSELGWTDEERKYKISVDGFWRYINSQGK